jgi:hypothetical protein
MFATLVGEDAGNLPGSRADDGNAKTNTAKRGCGVGASNRSELRNEKVGERERNREAKNALAGTSWTGHTK